MQRATRFVVAVVVSAVAGVVATGCSFDFRRTHELAPGDIAGQAVRPDQGEKGAPFVELTSMGTNIIRRGQPDGSFVVRGLPVGTYALRLVDDPDGDGWPNRVGFAAARIEGDVDTGTASGFVDLGGVPVEGTMSVTGTVFLDDGHSTPPAAAGKIARVYLTRDQCFDLANAAGAQNASDCDGASAAALAARLSTGAEAETSVDATGAFTFVGVGPGHVFVVAALFDSSSSTLYEGLRTLSAPVAANGDPDAPVVLDTAILLDPNPPAPPQRQVQLVVNPAVGADGYVVLRAPGSPSPACTADAPAPQVPTDVVLDKDAVPDGSDVAITVPEGVYDVYVCAGRARGVAYEQIAAPGDDVVVWGPITLLAGAECDVDGKRDCDADGLTGLPPLVSNDDPNLALWQQCALQCPLDPTKLGGATCLANGTTFDCDDDGDGEADVTEVQDCYGLGRGTDLDADRICSPVDPYPQCAANTADACVAGTNDHAPSVPRQYSTSGPFDPTFGDSGRVVLVHAGDDHARGVAIDALGRIVVAGSTHTAAGELDAIVWRFTPDGALDTTFGTGGFLASGVPGDDEAFGVAVDGVDIYAAGVIPGQTAATDAAVAKIDGTAGAFDVSFGNNGLLRLADPNGGTGALHGIAAGKRQDGVGRIVAVGTNRDLAGNDAASVFVRDEATGAVDSVYAALPTLYVSGPSTATTDGLPFSEANGAVLRADDFIYIGGDFWDGAPNLRDEISMRFDASGAEAFTPQGSLPENNVYGRDQFFAIALDLQDRVLAAGRSLFDTRSSLRLKRLFPGLGLDEPFCIQSKAALRTATSAAGIVVDKNGFVVIAGQDAGHLLVARLDDNGNLDPAFFGGRVQDSEGLGGSNAGGVAIDENGRIVVAGDITLGGADVDVAVWRVLPTSPNAGPPGDGGTTTTNDAGTTTDAGTSGGAGSWTAGPSMASARSLFTMTLFDRPDLGRFAVEAIGGFDGTTDVGSVEILEEPAPTGTLAWAAGPSLPAGEERDSHTATEEIVATQRGRSVVVAGGFDSTGTALATAWRLDAFNFTPFQFQWTQLANLASPRAHHAAVLVDGATFALIAGGLNGSVIPDDEIVPTGGPAQPAPLLNAVDDEALVALDATRVLLVGGRQIGGPTTETDVYDIASGTWSPGPSLAVPRDGPTATLLPSGEVVVVGGIDASNAPIGTVEILDATASQWTTLAAPLNVARNGHTATLLADGRVLVVGGRDASQTPTISAELIDVAAGTITPAADLPGPRADHAAIALPDGTVLVAGGVDSGSLSTLSTTLVYTP